MQRTYVREQTPRRPGTRQLQNIVLKKRERTPVWQIRGESDCKTASPQRYTQKPRINNDVFIKN